MFLEFSSEDKALLEQLAGLTATIHKKDKRIEEILDQLQQQRHTNQHNVTELNNLLQLKTSKVQQLKQVDL